MLVCVRERERDLSSVHPDRLQMGARMSYRAAVLLIVQGGGVVYRASPIFRKAGVAAEIAFRDRTPQTLD